MADHEQVAFSSPLVIEGQRPRWLYRTDAINEVNSGWRFFEGSESDAWLAEDGHCVMEHLGHMSARWPELESPLGDDRARSAWEWDESSAAYVEVRNWAD
jgi:hypothetical protein